jgi:hypothetical protein
LHPIYPVVVLAYPAIVVVKMVFFKDSSKNSQKPVSMYLKSNYETLLKYYRGNGTPNIFT